jgi:hypothetical protein
VSAVDGYNVCIFAYGQTGSGKTFTIYGTQDNPGLTPRAIQELFTVMQRDEKKFSFSLKVVRMEIPYTLYIPYFTPLYYKNIEEVDTFYLFIHASGVHVGALSRCIGGFACT